MPKGDTKETRRGRGRPPREPKLLPSGADYALWCEFHEPALEGILRVFDVEQLEWDTYVKLCMAAVEARERGLADVPDPVEPSPESSVYSLLRTCAVMSTERRTEIVRELGQRRRPMPGKTASIADIVRWLVGEALAAGIGCDFDTAYQAWFVFADLVLRDADIGAIIARVHPERVGYRSPRLSDDAVKALNAALARQERKRVNAKRSTFGYSPARIM
jgi:hypothetical protein